jgi:hypothetical protein
MKESTKLILAFAGAGGASYLLLSGPVAGATENYPMAAPAGEGLVALGGAYGAWKLKGGKRMVSAVVGGVAAGLLVNSIRAGLTKPAPTQQAPVVISQPAPTPSIAVGEPTKAAPPLTVGTASTRPLVYSSPPILAPKQELLR